MTLKAASLKTMKRGRHPDGRYGLYFNVIGNSRTWVQRLTIDGKRRNFGLGPWPVVSLSEARASDIDNSIAALPSADSRPRGGPCAASADQRCRRGMP